MRSRQDQTRQWMKTPRLLKDGVRAAVVLVLLIASVFLSPSAHCQANPTVQVSVVGERQEPLAGVTVEASQGGPAVATAKTGDGGKATVACAPRVSCVITASLPGYKSAQAEVTVQEQMSDPVSGQTQDQAPEVLIQLVKAIQDQQTVEVRGASDSAVATSSASVTSLPMDEAKMSPLRPATLVDALPLVPGVIRTPDGRVKIAGLDEDHSALLVNSVDVTDPATGSFGLSIPVDSVDVLKVVLSPYLAQYGNFTAGVVSAETRRGGDKWKFDLNDPLPEFRIRSGHLQGLRTATPRLNLSGPLVKDRLYFLEGSEYLLNKAEVRTLQWPVNETRSTAFNSFTQLDAMLTDRQTITASLHFAPHSLQFANLNYFDPQPVTPNADYQEDTGTITHRFALAGGLLTSTLAGTRVAANVSPQTLANMILNPAGNSGSYFSQESREATRFQWMETWSPAAKNWHGTHTLQVGAVLAHADDEGQFLAHSVQITDASGHLLRNVDFSGNGGFSISDNEPAVYAQDHWMVNRRLAFDFGLRWEEQSVTYTARTAPRAGFTWTPSESGNTVVRSGMGVFYDQVALGTYAFHSYPQQVVTTYDGNGNITDGPRSYLNLTSAAAESEFPFLDQGTRSGNFAPYSVAWNVELEQRVRSQVTLRVRYLNSNLRNQITLTPQITPNWSALVLGDSGVGQTRQMDFTAGFGSNKERQFYFSYVRQFAHGDLSDAAGYLGDFPFPVVRSSFAASTAGEIPNRFMLWGTTSLPWRMHLSPHIEYRNGFPYQPTNALQDYVPFSSYIQPRFPRYLSADARIAKDFDISPKHAIRLSLSGINLTNHTNPLQVHSNTGDPQYGTFFGNYGRHILFDFDFLY